MIKQMIVAAGVLCLAVGCTKKPEELGGQNSPSSSDKDNKFITTATEANLTEIKTGEMAENKSSDPAVKDFAKKLVADHEKASKEVGKVATSVGAKPPTELDSEHENIIQDVQKDDGQAFDSEFLKDQIKAHKETIKAARDEQSDGTNPQVKQLAKDLLPTLQDHLTEAEALKAKMEKTGSATTKPAAM